jgi:hypothetical protein
MPLHGTIEFTNLPVNRAGGKRSCVKLPNNHPKNRAGTRRKAPVSISFSGEERRPK